MEEEEETGARELSQENSTLSKQRSNAAVSLNVYGDYPPPLQLAEVALALYDASRGGLHEQHRLSLAALAHLRHARRGRSIRVLGTRSRVSSTQYSDDRELRRTQITWLSTEHLSIAHSSLVQPVYDTLSNTKKENPQSRKALSVQVRCARASRLAWRRRL